MSSDLENRITVSSFIGQPYILEGDVPFTIVAGNLQGGAQSEGIAYAMEAIRNSGGNGIGVVSDGMVDEVRSWNESQGVQVIGANEVVEIIDKDRFFEEYGIDIDSIGENGKILLASSILKSVFNANPVAMLGSDVKEDTNPLAWMSWAYPGEHASVAISQKLTVESQRTVAANAGVNNHLGVKNIGKGNTGIHKHVIETNTGLVLPNATTPGGQRLIQTIARGEFDTSRQPTQLISLRESSRPQGLSNGQLDILNSLMFELRETDLTNLSPQDIRRINSTLEMIVSSDEEPNLILPSIKSMFDCGVIDQHKYFYLIADLHGREWHNNQRQERNVRDITSEIIPDDEPSDFGSLLEEANQFIESLSHTDLMKLREQLFQTNGNNRPLYGVIDSLPPAIRKIVTCMIYNIGPEGYREPLNLWGQEDEVREIREKSLTYLRGTHVNPETGREVPNVIVIIPFVGETISVGRTTSYAKSRVGAENVIAISARSNEEAEGYVDRDVKKARQTEVLEKYDWRKMADDGLIPHDILDETGLPVGLKSLTMLSGMIELMEAQERGEIDDETWVAFYDSDIMNPGDLNEEELGPNEKDLARPENWYDALMYMGVAMADGEKKGIRAVHVARSGAGRNNQTVQFVMDDFINSKNPDIRKLGLSLAPLVWPLTGERAYKWGDLKQMVWAKDMFIETILDLNTAGRDAYTGVRSTAQIMVPVPKIECADSNPEREWGMLNGLARALNSILRQMEREEIPANPMQWTDAHLSSIQAAMVDQRLNIQLVTIDLGNIQSPRKVQLAIGDNAMPSFRIMQKYRKNAA